ncbi:MAG: glycosyltransferase family 4 protein [Actinomycetota bacterium]
MALTIALLVTALTTPAFAWVAHRLGVVDRPGPLKVQSRPVAYLGGLAVLAGVVAAVAPAAAGLLPPLAAAAALGLLDDIADLTARLRFAAEIVIGALVVLAVDAPALTTPIVIVGTILLVNAVNLLDGLDALASGTVLASAIGFALILDGDPQILAAGMAGALAGFLIWNRPPARVYLGDSGSYLLGTGLSVLAAATLGDGGSTQWRAAAVLLLGVPVADTSVAIVRRWRAKRPLLVGDRGHVYDQLVTRGWTARRAVIACVLAQIALAVVAVVVSGLGAVEAVLVAGLCAAAAATWTLARFTSPSSWV